MPSIRKLCADVSADLRRTGRSLAIEIAQRLGMPLPVVAAARGFLSDDQKRLAAHLARLDAQARALEAERSRWNGNGAR